MSACFFRSIYAVALLAGAAAPAFGADAKLPPEQLKFFETHVRPVLAENCFKCHGGDKQRGGLRLDSRGGLLAGGESGPAIVPGRPEESLLIEAINYASYEMPPTGKLGEKEIAALTEWVRIGAPWPGSNDTPPAAAARKPKITDEDRQWWAFQPVREVAPPQVDDGGWLRNDIDPFIFDRLREAGLTPAPEADRRTLIRRLYFDLIGLPPTPEEVESFVADESPRAYEELVDRLLDSPHYGEKWARHWLDLVRYAESDGYNQDAYRPHAWRYRDYVVRSLNEDKPYDRFVMEQIAGDEIAPGDPDALTATGYLRHWIYEYNQRDARTQWDTIVNDITDTTGDVFLAIGMGCARCHDHKFDPILQDDYFRLRAFFAAVLPRDDVPLATPSERAAYEQELAAWEAKTADIRRQIEEIEKPYREKVANQAIEKFPPDIRPMLRKPAEAREPLEHQLADLVNRQVLYEYDRMKLKKEDQERVDALRKQLEEFEADKPEPLPLGYTVTDVGPIAPATTIPGDRKERDVPPGLLTNLDPEPVEIEPVSTALQSTGRRTALARWLTHPENPLTTRVIVNRVWQYHFGTGLVATSSDFGRLGEPPSHPELLDWLARNFVANGWRLKSLHRLIVTSATYRQSASPPEVERGMSTDPTNRLLWRGNIRRLEAEQIRDAALAVSGRLDPSMGGPSVDADVPRRGLYVKVKRNVKDPLFAAFDVAEGITSTAQRNVTTTPTQSLLMINGEWMLQRAGDFAGRLQREFSGSDVEQVRAAFRLALGREPFPDETEESLTFLEEQARRISAPAGPPTKPLVETMPHWNSQAAVLRPGSPQDRLYVPDREDLPKGDFTIEAVILLRSLYEDAAVRVIASQWDGNPEHAGWSFGVTSAKSKFQPRNLIVQLVGETADGKSAYEVLASNLHPKLDRPYYVAATIDLDDTSENGVTFYMQDLSDPDAPLQTARVPHKITQNYRSNGAFTIGGRDSQPRSNWDGLIDDVRLSNRALEAEELLLSGRATGTSVGYWRFEDEPGFFADSTPYGHDIRTSRVAENEAREAALTDLCHVLLNSNEFLYVD